MSKDTRIQTRPAQATEPIQQRRQIPPRTDVYENGNEVLVVADMPGVDVDGLELRFEKNELHITGRRPAPPFAEQQEAGWDFHRRFVVPSSIDTARISAELASGTLTVHLPKSEAFQPRTIAVKVG